MKKAGIVCCSNGLPAHKEDEISKLKQQLRQLNIIAVESPYLYASHGIRSADSKKRAEVITKMNDDETIDMIFDVSGGDIANEILDELDFQLLHKPFWGYSDLTTVLNAIYAKTARPSVLYQIRHITDNEQQKKYWQEKTLFDLNYKIIKGQKVSGIVIGGNIRCFLKLAGTSYFPDVKDKILLLEANSGDEAKLITYFSQLKQMGVFQQIRGVLLGTFSQYYRQHDLADLLKLLEPFVSNELTIISTADIGHGKNAKAIVIGKEYVFS